MVVDTPQDIKNMFDRLCHAYDRFNRLSSLGMDARWRRCALREVRKGMRILDLGTGTGDLALAALKNACPGGAVVGLDVSQAMLNIARLKEQKNAFTPPVRWVCRPAEDIPFEEEAYDMVVSGFVLRNIRHNILSILAGVHRALREGGKISFVDLTEPNNAGVRFMGNIYFKTWVRFCGRLLFRDTEPITYLRQSMQNFFRPHEFTELLRNSGFKHIKTRSFLFGMVTHYSATKQGKIK